MPKQAGAQRAGVALRPEQVLWGLSAGLCVMLAALHYALWLPEHSGYRQVRLLQAQVTQMQEQTAQLEVRNAALKADIESLQDGLDAIEERARSDLGMIREGETLYRLLEPLPPADP